MTDGKPGEFIEIAFSADTTIPCWFSGDVPQEPRKIPPADSANDIDNMYNI
jgi:hypothetical protein